MRKKQSLYDETAQALTERIAHRLIEFRTAANLSQEEISVKADISLSGIRKMEDKDQSNPTVSFLNQYVKACGRNLGEFFEPWLPPGSIQYDQHVHRTIAAALKDNRSRPHIYTLVQMLREMKVG
jgi:transcriptional regulator with XRE-family HTH domain